MADETQTQAGIEVAQTEDGNVVLKRGDEVLTLDKVQQALDKEKNLEAGYTKKYQEIAEMKKELAAKFADYEEFDKALGEDPELKAKIEEIFNGHKGKGKAAPAKNDGDPVSELKSKIQEIEAREQEKQQKEKMQQIISYYDGEMSKAFTEMKVSDEEMQKDIKDLAWNKIAASQGKIEIEELKAFIASKAKKYAIDSKLAEARTDKTPVGGKGGGGGRMQDVDKAPKFKTKEFKTFARSTVANIFARHKNKSGG